MKIFHRFFSTILISIYSSCLCAADWDFKAETKLNYRDSEYVRFPTNFPPGSAHETVDRGDHLELSNIALFFRSNLTPNISLHVKFDLIDLYEKNPTSSDLKASLDRFILRYGQKSLFPQNTHLSWYAQIGKFGKFERQEDRHLESYGLVSTAFNRVEDSGIELGIDFPHGFYTIASYTSGNPVFFRDANALSGDNGVTNNRFSPGILVLYDAEVEGLDLGDTPELGLAAGYRWVSAELHSRFNFMLFSYQRDLAESKELHGTFYGGDLDLFEFSELFTPGPVDPLNDQSSIPLTSEDKSEYGANLWWYYNNVTLFAQHVEQDVGGLERSGSELELSYKFKTDGLSWLNSVDPTIRASQLQNNFTVPTFNPSPSIAWDWKKLDIGFTLHFTPLSFLTVEHANNSVETSGSDKDFQETLLTYTWRYD